MNRLLVPLAAAAAALGAVMSAPPASAVVIVELFADDFSTEANELNAALDNWDLVDGTVDVVGPLFLACPAPLVNPCLDMDGSTGNAARIETVLAFDLAPGDYELSFDFAGNQRGGTDDMSFGVGPFSGLLDDIASNAPAQSRVFGFTVLALTLAAEIFFDHAGGDNVGILLDNVRLVRIDEEPPPPPPPPPPPGVPEPGTISLLGLGLAGLALGLRRRKTT